MKSLKLLMLETLDTLFLFCEYFWCFPGPKLKKKIYTFKIKVFVIFKIGKKYFYISKTVIIKNIYVLHPQIVLLWREKAMMMKIVENHGKFVKRAVVAKQRMDSIYS